MSHELSLFASRASSPITDWLRALCRATHAELGGVGVGALGMCISGNFALALMVDACVMAPVLEPAVAPGPAWTATSRAGLHLSDADFAIVKRRVREDGVRVLGLRFTGDPLCPARASSGSATSSETASRGSRSIRHAATRTGSLCCALGPDAASRRSRGASDESGARPRARLLPRAARRYGLRRAKKRSYAFAVESIPVEPKSMCPGDPADDQHVAERIDPETTGRLRSRVAETSCPDRVAVVVELHGEHVVLATGRRDRIERTEQAIVPANGP